MPEALALAASAAASAAALCFLGMASSSKRTAAQAGFEDGAEASASSADADASASASAGATLACCAAAPEGHAVPSWATGELIRLSAPASGLSLTVVVEERRSCHRGAVAISLPGSPFARLRVTSEQTVDFGGKGDGNDTIWVATDPTSSVTGLTHAYKGKAYALVATREGLAVHRRSSSDPRASADEKVANSLWHATAVSMDGDRPQQQRRPDGVSASGPSLTATPPTRPAQRLQPSQLAEFARDGCLVVPGLVPADVLFRAQTSVNSRLGRPSGVGLFYDDARKVIPHARRMPSGHLQVLLPLDTHAVQGGADDKNGVGRMGGTATTDPALLEVLNCPEVMRLIGQLIGVCFKSSFL